MSKTVKQWDKIMDSYTSGEESDEHDVPNIRMLQKNGPKIMDMMSRLIDVNNVPTDLKEAHEKGKQNFPEEQTTKTFKQVNNELSNVNNSKKS
tara:strand:+ start:883 stop:1161 length:279 start_codon:yes stop_codon:yes gene_type:complete